MNKILLDTSVIIDYLRLKSKGSSGFEKLAAQNYDLFISLITHAELYAGKDVWESKQARNTLENILSEIQILGINEELSKKAGEIRAKYNIELADAIIAATAISNNYPLATLNVKDFETIKGIKIAKIK